MVDLEAVKKRQQQAWASGDFSMVASTNTIVGELLCEAVDLRAGQRVLDVATGSGNTALAAARRWCQVTGIDWVPALLERARERAAVERLAVAFKEGDAEDIPFPEASFDVVLSTFGAMFAPNQEGVATELLRVCRPGGKIGMANWTPEGLVGEFFRATAAHVTPPAGLRPAVLWGSEGRLRELLGKHATLQIVRRSFLFRYHSPQHWMDFMRSYYGPTVKAFEALDQAGREALAGDLMKVIERFNRSGDQTVVAPAEYLEVVATKR